MEDKVIAKIPIKYTGPTALNARSISDSVSTILGRDESGKSLTTNTLEFSELVNLLNFLEVAVMSNQIYYDGTLPVHEISKVQESVGLISELPIGEIQPIQVKNIEHLASLCKGAAEQSSELIKAIQVDALISNSTDRPVKNYTDFKTAILESYKSKRNQKETAQLILNDILESKKSFTGSKCVAGICLAELEDVELIQVVAEKFLVCKNEDEEMHLVGALINRFRTNYINKLASQDEYEAAFLITPGLESIQSQQTVLLWKYLLRRIHREYNDRVYQNVQHLFSGQYTTFPLGFAALLHPGSKNPQSLFENTMRLKNDRFVKLLAKNSPQERYIHQYDEQEFKDFQDSLLGDVYHKFKTGRSASCDMVINRLPEIIGIGAATAFAAFVKDHNTLLDIASEIAGGVILRDIVAKGLNLILPNRKYNVFLNNLEKLGDFYNEAMNDNDEIQKRMVNQVETIFKRKLIMG